jgi:hypothetical protein
MERGKWPASLVKYNPRFAFDSALSINTGDALFRLAGKQEKPDEEAACSV